VKSSRRPLATAAAVALVAVLAACTSDPSPKRVAQDLVRTEAKSERQETCMLGVIDDYDLNELGKDAISDNEQIAQEALAQLDEFEADLAECPV
jgi:uncharacterized lipoprotein